MMVVATDPALADLMVAVLVVWMDGFWVSEKVVMMVS